jgi:hypothetical protein
MQHTFYNSDDEAIRMSFTGTATVTYTDLSNGRVFSPPSSGPGTVDLATGQWIFRGGNGTVVAAEALLATNGKLVLDADFNVISMTGKQNNVYAALVSREAPGVMSSGRDVHRA